MTDDTLTIKVCHNEPESLLNSPTCRPSRLLDHTRRRNPQRALRDVCRRASAENVRESTFWRDTARLLVKSKRFTSHSAGKKRQQLFRERLA